MANVVQWLKAQLGPSPLTSLSMLVMTICGVLAAFKITPSVPPWFGYAVLLILVASATSYCARCVLRLWRQVVPDLRTGSYRLRQRVNIDAANGALPGIAALDELNRMIGLDNVKTEINTLIQRLRVEAVRRDQGLPVAPI